jgi:GTP-binding protein
VKRIPLTFDRAVLTTARLPKPFLPEIALLGRSNVGKSSLLNNVAGQKSLARTSNTPGRTQSLNFYKSGETLYLVDLPGYGYAKVPERVRQEWRKLIEKYLETRESLVGGILILDIRRDPTDLDRVMHDWLVTRKLPHLVVATKMDKLSRSQAARSLSTIRKEFNLMPDGLIGFSAKTGDGRDRVSVWIEEQKRTS